MADQDINRDQLVRPSDITKSLSHNTKTSSHQVSATTDQLEQLSNTCPSAELANRNGRNTEIEQSVPPGTPQIVSSYFPPSRSPYTSTSRQVPTTTSGKDRIPSMLDIVNAGYQRRINHRHHAHSANRYQCIQSDDESDNEDNTTPIV